MMPAQKNRFSLWPKILAMLGRGTSWPATESRAISLLLDPQAHKSVLGQYKISGGCMGKTFIGKAEVLKTAKDGYQGELDNEWHWLLFLNGYGKSAYGPPRPARITSCNLVKPIGYEDGENLSPAMRDFYRNKTFVMSRAPGSVFDEIVPTLAVGDRLAAYLHAFNFVLELERLDVADLAENKFLVDSYNARRQALAALPESPVGQYLQEQGLLEAAQQLLTAHALRMRPCLRHRDLHSYNVLYEPETRTLTPIDFGMMKVTTDNENYSGLRLSQDRKLYDLARDYYNAHTHTSLSPNKQYFAAAGTFLFEAVLNDLSLTGLKSKSDQFEQIMTCLTDIVADPIRLDKLKPPLTPQQINAAADKGFDALEKLVNDKMSDALENQIEPAPKPVAARPKIGAKLAQAAF